jgi:glycosyltransferase involved in cell wall biosynthesis
VVVVFYNMQREAARTLHSLSTAYQRGIAEHEYEVLAIDSGSSEPLDRRWVESQQNNFRYLFVESEWPTPCRAMNTGIEQARAKRVACSIDGARILSPGILAAMLQAERLFPNPFVYTLGMHLGHKRQNVALAEGYNQEVEDRLIATVDWQADGYRLFDISVLAYSSICGFFGTLKESNLFAAPKVKLRELGGFDERFRIAGGGLVNLDLFNRLAEADDLEPVMLLGEATFHQFHGGVSTNVPPGELRLQEYKDEYRAIRGKEYATAAPTPYYFGRVPHNTKRILFVPEEEP